MQYGFIYRSSVVIAAVLLSVGCSDLVPPPGQRAEELAARARDLQNEIMAANSVNQIQQQAFDRLVTDIEAYNAAAGNHDISVETAVMSTPCQAAPAYSARFIDPDVNPACTVNCPLFPSNRPEGYFCLPDGQSFCDPRTGISVCSYRCVKIPLSDLFDSRSVN